MSDKLKNHSRFILRNEISLCIYILCEALIFIVNLDLLILYRAPCKSFSLILMAARYLFNLLSIETIESRRALNRVRVFFAGLYCQFLTQVYAKDRAVLGSIGSSAKKGKARDGARLAVVPRALYATIIRGTYVLRRARARAPFKKSVNR